MRFEFGVYENGAMGIIAPIHQQKLVACKSGRI